MKSGRAERSNELQPGSSPPIHPSAGGSTWSADLELGEKVHELLGNYLPRVASCAQAERQRLLVELAGKLYDLHGSKRIEFVRPGCMEDCNIFDREHAIRAGLAVWHPLEGVHLSDAERQAIKCALAGCRSRWLKEAIQRANAGSAPPDSKTPARAQQWADIEIIFLSDERVGIKIGGTTETRNYAEMGFAKKSGKPKLAWFELRDFAEKKGVKRIASNSQQWTAVEKRMQEIRKVLRSGFRLSEDPLPFIKKTRRQQDDFGYRARFKIGCGSSYNS